MHLLNLDYNVWDYCYLRPLTSNYAFYSLDMYLITWEKLTKDKLWNNVIYISQEFSIDHTFEGPT